MCRRRAFWRALFVLGIAVAGCSSQHGASPDIPSSLVQSGTKTRETRHFSSATGPSTLCTLDPHATCYQVNLGDTLSFAIAYPTQLCGTSILLSFLDAAAAQYNFTTTVNPLYQSPPSPQNCNGGRYTVNAQYTVATTQNTTATEIAGGFALYNTNSSPAPPGSGYTNYFGIPPADAVDIVFIHPTPSPTPNPSATPWVECWPVGPLIIYGARHTGSSRPTPTLATTRRGLRPNSSGGFLVECATASPPATPTPSPGQTPGPTPAPGLVVYDTAIQRYGTSQIISNEVAPIAAPIMVGQEAFLQVAAASPYGSVPTNISWIFATSAPTDVVANYSLSSTGAFPTTLLPPESVASAGYTAAGSGPTVAPVYWVKKGVKSIAVTASVAGQSVGASVQYLIHAPTVTTATQTFGSTFIGTGPCCGSTLCVIGDECILAGGPYAALWTYSVTTPKEGAGQIAVGQVINDELWTLVGGSAVAKCTNKQYWLDATFPYADPTTVYGSASATWTPPDGPHDAPEFDVQYAKAAQAARIFSAHDYWMYAPAVTSSRPSIWVTLEKSTWTFSNSWTEVPTPNPSPTGPTPTPSFVPGTPVAAAGVTGTAAYATTDLPSWPQVAAGNYVTTSCNQIP